MYISRENPPRGEIIGKFGRGNGFYSFELTEKFRCCALRGAVCEVENWTIGPEWAYISSLLIFVKDLCRCWCKGRKSGRWKLGGGQKKKGNETRTFLEAILLGALMIGICLLCGNAVGAFVIMVF